MSRPALRRRIDKLETATGVNNKPWYWVDPDETIEQAAARRGIANIDDANWIVHTIVHPMPRPAGEA